MRRRVPSVLGLLALSLAATTSALAQSKPADGAQSRRQGFFFGLGLGGGSRGFECNGCNADRKSGGSGYLRLGASLSPHWLLGAEIGGWVRSEAGVDMALANVALVASWYPSRTGGFFLKFGLGGMGYTHDEGTGKTETVGGSGIIGVGYDIPLRRSFALTPYVNWMASSSSTVKINGIEVPLIEINPNLVQVGLALSWY